ncbi:MAG: bifunctional oligoribonuclease/PAP phosphatase NrnA [Clostridia bacterium]|jgi:bifunctional oligoribonuclease and PAP phosphatase NrnA|nr:bifunctional oligoribonuclease/PAP phosphatase NrnA [Clostridia bacterium]MBT7123361.1 bifunctional oligoribonuclease/PAP phosphatase NrnA [Clostridia bacterium]
MSQGLVDIKNALLSADSILIIAHTQPDGDTLGSCFALHEALCSMGKNADICCDGLVPAKYVELFPNDIIKTPNAVTKSYDTAIALDCADKARLGKSVKVFKKSVKTINIDHHITNDKFAKTNYIKEASSVGEIIFELIDIMKAQIGKAVALYLYIAISTDTGNFTYSNTNKNCLTYVSSLVEHIDIRAVADILFRRRSLASTKLIGRAISTLELYNDGKIASLTITQSDLKQIGATSADCENIVDYAREIEQTKVAVFFREIPHGVKISMRSKDEVDVCAIAQLFGGGGHKNAAGCCISGKMDDAKKKLLGSLMEIV